MEKVMGVTSAVGVVACFVAGAAAQVVPFTEGFDASLNGWQGGSGFSAVLGGVGGDGFARSTGELRSGGFGAVTVLSGAAINGASGGAFVGDYLASGIDTLTVDIRHDADVPLTFFARIATAGNFPAIVVPAFAPVGPGDGFTTLTFSLDPSNAAIIPEGPPSLIPTVLAAVGNVQFLAAGPAEVDGQTVTFDFDNVTITPTPGTAGVLALAGLAVSRRRRG